LTYLELEAEVAQVVALVEKVEVLVAKVVSWEAWPQVAA
jgi:hypothetical protein